MRQQPGVVDLSPRRVEHGQLPARHAPARPHREPRRDVAGTAHGERVVDGARRRWSVRPGELVRDGVVDGSADAGELRRGAGPASRGARGAAGGRVRPGDELLGAAEPPVRGPARARRGRQPGAPCGDDGEGPARTERSGDAARRRGAARSSRLAPAPQLEEPQRGPDLQALSRIGFRAADQNGVDAGTGPSGWPPGPFW